MTESVQDSIGAAPQWLAALVRVTAFPCNYDDIGSELDWEALVGEAPQSVEQQPRLKINVAKGPFATGELVQARYPDRTEVVFAALIDGSLFQAQANGFPNLGEFSQALASFRPLVDHWLAGLPLIKRIAFAPTLIFPAGNHADAYERLNAWLPTVTVDNESSDFLYQINRPRISMVMPSIRINRLSKWSALRAAFTIQAAGGEPIPTPERFACRLEVDVNTQQEFDGPIPSDQLPQLFDELVALGIEISAKGDIP